MRNPLRPVFTTAAIVIAVACGAGAAAGFTSASPPPALRDITVSVPQTRPLGDDASAGRVTFTFDDGPDAYTQALLNELEALHLKAVFFVIGFKAEQYPALIREEAEDGDLVENHTYDHTSFTGASTDTPAMIPSKILAELAWGDQSIVAAGAPEPLLYRPPFGDVTAADNAIAAALGLRIVEPFSVTPRGLPIDSRDWTGVSAPVITRDVTRGYWVKTAGKMRHVPGLHAGSIIGFHDSSPGTCSQQETLCGYAVNTIRSLPAIVAYMNAHHLGVTVDVPPNATGGVVPVIP